MNATRQKWPVYKHKYNRIPAFLICVHAAYIFMRYNKWKKLLKTNANYAQTDASVINWENILKWKKKKIGIRMQRDVNFEIELEM